MKKLLACLCCASALLSVSCGKRIAKTESVDIVPKIASAVLTDSVFDLSATTSIRLMSADSGLVYAANFFNGVVEKPLGKKLPVNRTNAPAVDAINLGLNESFAPEEYQLNILPDRIVIEGGSPAGVFYALQSLRQLLPEAAVQGERARVIELPTLEIRDKPSFAYRGVMLDVSRHFFSVEDVKAFIDLIAMHKMNRLHWHLTDDQGWRIEIKQYPRLTEVGSVREKSLVNHLSDSIPRFDDRPYGGFYTQDEVRDIVRYAQERFVTVVPEIEMPGHALAALTAYPELGCVGEDYEVATTWGIKDDVFCAGKEETFVFLENVLGEVIELFPSEYIHIGGDEVRKGRWQECPLCQQRIRREGLRDEKELQSYFIQRIERFLNGTGRRIIGWEEILEGGVSKSATVMSWRSALGGIEAAKHGNDVIMVPKTHCYFDYYQSRDKENEPLAIGGYVPLEKVYELDPYEGLRAHERGFILGVQANLWTEYIDNLDQAEYMLLPRLAALSETAWSYGSGKDYDDFKRRLGSLRRFYDAAGYDYGRHLWEGEGAAAPEAQ